MKNFKIHFLNTVWSDAILLESNSHFALVDTASKFYYPMIEEYLEKHNIKKLDFILLTHFHSDHYGNLINIVNDYNINKVYMKHYSAKEGDTGGGFPTNEEYTNHEMGVFNDIISTCKNKNVDIVFLDNEEYYNNEPFILKFEDVDLELYNLENNLEYIFNDSSSPYYQKHIFSENSNSIVAYINCNGHKLFLGSDLTESQSDEKKVNLLNEVILNNIYSRHNINQIDVFKSCHHGGSGANRQGIANMLKAKYVVITNTDKWLDNWSTRDNFKNAYDDVCILQTDYYKYVFDFSKENISYEKINSESLFITLNKN